MSGSSFIEQPPGFRPGHTYYLADLTPVIFLYDFPETIDGKRVNRYLVRKMKKSEDGTMLVQDGLATIVDAIYRL